MDSEPPPPPAAPATEPRPPRAAAATEAQTADPPACPVCREPEPAANAPVVTPCGHSFRRSCLSDGLLRAGIGEPRCLPPVPAGDAAAASLAPAPAVAEPAAAAAEPEAPVPVAAVDDEEPFTFAAAAAAVGLYSDRFVGTVVALERDRGVIAVSPHVERRLFRRLDWSTPSCPRCVVDGVVCVTVSFQAGDVTVGDIRDLAIGSLITFAAWYDMPPENDTRPALWVAYGVEPAL